MKKIVILVLLIGFIITSALSKSQAMPNPWVDCQDNFECATKVSGINFPLTLSNYWIRAMKNMIEISYPLDEFRNVVVRKTELENDKDISGVYTKFPINKKLKLKNGVKVDIRGTFRKIYVMNLSAETGIYSAYCKQGMSKKEVQGVYEVIKEAEEPKLPFEALQNKYSFCELGDLVGKDVKRIKYQYYNVDYHTKDFTQKEVLEFAKECLLEGVVTQSEMDCCMINKMYPETH